MLEVFSPLADQLGVWSLKAELEDLAFQVLGMLHSLPLHPPCLKRNLLLAPCSDIAHPSCNKQACNS